MGVRGTIFLVLSFFSVDATYSQSQNNFLNHGRVLGWVYENNPLEQPVLKPFPNLKIANEVLGFGTYTSANGDFYVPRLNGLDILFIDLGGIHTSPWRRLRINPNQLGSGNIFLSDYEGFIQNNIFKKTTMAERNALYHIERGRQALKDINSDWLSQPIVVQFGVGDAICNAYHSGETLYFDNEGTQETDTEVVSCRNTAESPNVIYHELYHHFLFTLKRELNLPTDEVADEAYCDIFASFMTDDPRIGHGIYLNRPDSTNYIRRIDYKDAKGVPVVYIPGISKRDVHVESLVLSGAMWDLRESLMKKYGRDSGNKIALKLFLDATFNLPRTSNFYEALLMADNKNKNSSVRPPHYKEIQDAFSPRCISSQLNASYCGRRA